MMLAEQRDIVDIGTEVAGLMRALKAGGCNRDMLTLDYARQIAKTIRISYCCRYILTNIHASLAQFFSNNLYFCNSALQK